MLQPTNLSERINGGNSAAGLHSNYVTNGLISVNISLLLGILRSDLRCLDWFAFWTVWRPLA